LGVDGGGRFALLLQSPKPLTSNSYK